MASATVNLAPTIVSGTATVYPRSNWPAWQAPSGSPVGSSTTSASVGSDGSVTFSGLTEGQEYVAYQGTPDRYVRFRVDTEPGTPGDPESVEPGTAGAPSTQTSVAVTTTAGDALAANASADYREFVNSGAGVVTLKLGSGAVTDYQGIALQPGGSWDGLVSGKLYTGLVRCKTVSGTATLSVVEG